METPTKCTPLLSLQGPTIAPQGDGTVRPAPLTLVFRFPPTKQAALRAQASNLNSTAGTADLTWSAPTSSAQTISGYRITVTYTDASGTTHTNTIIVPGTSNKYTLTGLTKGTTYTVSIAALDATGDLGTFSFLTFTL